MRVLLAVLLVILTLTSLFITYKLVTLTPSGASTAVMQFCLNTPPTPLPQECPNATANTPYFCDMNATDDWEGQPHIFTLNTSLLTINHSTGEVTFNPTMSDVGVYHINVTVTDDGCAYNESSALWIFHVLPLNDSDVLITWDTTDLTTVYKYEPVTIWANYTDNETNQTILANCSVSIENRTLNMTLDANTSLYWATFSPGFIQGIHNYTVQCDARSQGYASIRVNTSNLTITNRPPVLITPFPNITMRQGSRVSGYNLNDYFTDPDLDPLTFTSSNPANIHITIDASGIVTITPDSWWSGTRIARFTANDGYNQTPSNYFTITVIPNPTEEAPPSSGGGGSGGGIQIICIENWECSEWSACMPTGIRTRTCQDLSQCNTTRNKPPEVENCTYIATCNDGIRNCHDGACEARVDCGGPCPPCPSCHDGIQNQGEEGVDCGGPCPPCQRNMTLNETTMTLPYTPPEEPVGRQFPWLLILLASAAFAGVSSYAYQHAASILSRRPVLILKHAATPRPTPEAHLLIRLTGARSVKETARALQEYVRERYTLKGIPSFSEIEQVVRKHEKHPALRKALIQTARLFQESLYTGRRLSVEEAAERLVRIARLGMQTKAYQDALHAMLRQPAYARESILKALLHALEHATPELRSLLLPEALRLARSLPARKKASYLERLEAYLHSRETA